MWHPRVLLAVTLVVATACRREAAGLDEAQRVAYAVRPAVVRISAFATAEFHYRSDALSRVAARLDADGYPVPQQPRREEGNTVPTGAGGSGSGFVVHPDGVILTAGHVIAPTLDPKSLDRELRHNGAIAVLVRHFPVETLRDVHREAALDRYVAILAAGSTLRSVKVVNQVELSNGESFPFTVVRYSPALSERGSDLALLRVARRGLPSLALGDSESVRVGDTIWAVGYPAVASSSDEVIGGWLSRDSDLEPTFNPGTITAIRRNVARAPVFQTNVAIYRGNSGGPAVGRRGEVIGISSWGHTSVEQIKFLVPVNAAGPLFEQAGIRPAVDGEFNRRYRAAIDAASRGDWVGAKRELALTTRLFPGSPDLARFAHDADRGIAAMPAWKKHPRATLAVGTILVAMAAAAAFAWTRRRAPAPPPALPADPAPERVVSPGEGTPSPQALLGRFTILNGTKAGQKLGLGGSGIRIGRESSICEIVLENPKVSRLHAEVVSIDGKVMLIDRNSSNGTYVNDQKIDRRYLRDGDIIYFGGRNAVAVAFHA